MQPTDSPRDPVNVLAPKEPGAPAADDHDRMGPPSDETVRRGYELDTYDAKSVISVPLLVVLFFVLAFGTVTVLFNVIERSYRKGDPKAHPEAVERNKRPLNERIAGIGTDGQGGKSVREQPRLEPLRQRAGGELARAITQPETPEGNSPELHPEDLRVTKERFPALYQTGGGKYSLGAVMDPKVVGDEQLKALFPVQTNGSRPIDSQHVPTGSNAGRGAEASAAVAPPAPKFADKKRDEKKPDDKKSEPPKKPEEKKPEDKKPDPKPGEKKQ